MSQIEKGDRVIVSHPKDGVERGGVVEHIAYMAERDEVCIRIESLGRSVILHIIPGTKRRQERNDDPGKAGGVGDRVGPDGGDEGSGDAAV